MNTWKVILATLAIFCAGFVTGTLVNGIHSTAKPAPLPYPGEMMQQRLLERMKRELALTPQQTSRIEAIFRESSERTKLWWEIIGPDLQAEFREVREKVRAELDSNQRGKYEQLLKERRHQAGGPNTDRRPKDRRSAGSTNASPSPTNSTPVRR